MSELPVRIAITGAAGFLGHALSRSLLDAGVVALDGVDRPLGSLVLMDLFLPREEIAADPRVESLVGELDASIEELGEVDAIFHLSGVVSGTAEADFDLGLHTNLDGLRRLLDRVRTMSVPPVLVFSSSLAVYGADPHFAVPAEVDDSTLPRPQSSYGIQKFIGEQLVADYTRKGFVRGRSVRLMTVTVRPGKPNGAASSFISGIIREPLAGVPSTCPVPADTPVAVSSPARTLEGILRAAAVTAEAWGSRTAMNLPALTTTPAEMVASLSRIAGPEVAALVDWDVDQQILDIVGSWPAVFSSPRTEALGLRAPSDFDEIVREHLAATQKTEAARA